MNHKPVSKNQVVKEVITSLGFMKPECPPGWKQKVEKALAMRNVAVHETTIYQMRKRTLMEQARTAAKLRSEQAEQLAKIEKRFAEISLADAAEIKTLADKCGGFIGLGEAVIAAAEIAPLADRYGSFKKLAELVGTSEAIASVSERFGGFKKLADSLEVVEKFLSK